jgi:small-conductance mechanosensitive channel
VNTLFACFHFQAYGDFALTFETVYYVLSSDYNVYMDIQQSINLEFFRQFEAHGIRFAYPTQIVYLGKSTGAGAPEAAYTSSIQHA